MQTSKAKILVIDDSEEIREFLKDSVLLPAGYRTLLVPTGEKGLVLAQRVQPDLILLDYELPDLNGIEVLRALHKAGFRLPVILITSYGSESVAVEVFRLGVRDYVPKPFTVEEISDAITRVLKTVRVEEQRDALLVSLKKANRQLNRRLQELNTLYRVSKSVTSLRESERLLDRIVSAALYLTGATKGALILRNPKTGKSVVRAAKQQGGDAPADLEFANTVKIPVQIGGELLGALLVEQEGMPAALGKDHQQLLRMLADYAAIAIENNRLVQQLERQREREKRQLRTLFEHYVAPAVVEQILRRPESVKPGGRRQTVSVLFADLRGFTTFSAQTSPEALMAVLNQYLAAAAAQVLEKEGTLDKFMGDEVMAFFNAPLPQEDYAWRAVQAAVHILEATWSLQRKLPSSQRLDFGIGISTGEAIVGNVGMSNLVNFTVVGATINKAHALQEMAPAGGILICRETYEHVRNHVLVKELPPVRLKGQQEAEPIYEISVPARR
ncbi:MAG: response regulator [Anaerolineae bacterium]